MFATLGPVEISLDLSILLIRFQQTTRSSSVNSRKPAQANKNAIEVQLTTNVNNNVVTKTQFLALPAASLKLMTWQFAYTFSFLRDLNHPSQAAAFAARRRVSGNFLFNSCYIVSNSCLALIRNRHYSSTLRRNSKCSAGT